MNILKAKKDKNRADVKGFDKLVDALKFIQENNEAKEMGFHVYVVKHDKRTLTMFNSSFVFGNLRVLAVALMTQARQDDNVHKIFMLMDEIEMQKQKIAELQKVKPIKPENRIAS